MYCSNCGAKNEDNSLFCYQCGISLTTPTQPSAPTSTLPVSLLQRRNLMTFVAVAIATVAIVVFILVAFRQPPSSTLKVQMDTTEVGLAASQAAEDWLKSHPSNYAKRFPEETNYRILRSKVLSNDGSSARVAIFALTHDRYQIGPREWFGPSIWTPHETIVEARNAGGNWTAQPISSFESPFVGTLLAAESPNAKQCSGTLPQGTKPDKGYACIRVTNKGNFDWKWNELYGTGMGRIKQIYLPSGNSVDVVFDTAWKYFPPDDWYEDISLKDEGDMDIVLLPVPWFKPRPTSTPELEPWPSDTIGQPCIGVGSETVDEDVQSFYQLPVDHGEYIRAVSGEPALKIGIQVGDVIVSADGQEITSKEEWAAAISRAGAGNTLRIGLYRGQQLLQLQVQIGRRTAPNECILR